MGCEGFFQDSITKNKKSEHTYCNWSICILDKSKVKFFATKIIFHFRSNIVIIRHKKQGERRWAEKSRPGWGQNPNPLPHKSCLDYHNNTNRGFTTKYDSSRSSLGIELLTCWLTATSTNRFVCQAHLNRGLDVSIPLELIALSPSKYIFINKQIQNGVWRITQITNCYILVSVKRINEDVHIWS